MEAYAGRNARETTWRVLDAVETIADARGASMSQVSLAWLAAQPGVASVILGSRTAAQLTENLGAVDLELTPAELGSLDDASAPVTADYPYGAPGIDQRSRPIID
ncbi:hypothetical protein GCM10025881_17690 [Pseudolysinimonas kribbensis]|uniref:NADP-dependent oxidoreductase domain-containing protein n=1 Tax=Pseudolysinimonas kribbensis TaxID=433641 RepID=A0ABQ6K7I6_9MICO|nr:hypothetical protein GCM10025881_17690 [Pseudolysinimonas kribbensis]